MIHPHSQSEIPTHQIPFKYQQVSLKVPKLCEICSIGSYQFAPTYTIVNIGHIAHIRDQHRGSLKFEKIKCASRNGATYKYNGVTYRHNTCGVQFTWSSGKRLVVHRGNLGQRFTIDTGVNKDVCYRLSNFYLHWIGLCVRWMRVAEVCSGRWPLLEDSWPRELATCRNRYRAFWNMPDKLDCWLT